jgi:hypothetical protein
MSPVRRPSWVPATRLRLCGKRPVGAMIPGWGGEEKRATMALPLARSVAQNAPMKMVIYMVGALALIVVGSLTWTTMLLGSR